jgi:hypothetical protein
MAAGEKFLAWLKKKYPVTGVTLLSEYVDAPYLVGGHCGEIQRANASLYKLRIPTYKEAGKVLAAVAHEYVHYKQVTLGGANYKTMAKVRAYEDEAIVESKRELKAYIADVGSNWM